VLVVGLMAPGVAEPVDEQLGLDVSFDYLLRNGNNRILGEIRDSEPIDQFAQIEEGIMSAKAEQMLNEALSLPPRERAQLAERLFSSLDLSLEELDRLCAKEADSRIDAYERGELKTLSAQKVFKNIYS